MIEKEMLNDVLIVENCLGSSETPLHIPLDLLIWWIPPAHNVEQPFSLSLSGYFFDIASSPYTL